MLQFFKNDFRSVKSAIRMMYPKTPRWAILVYYLLLAPIGLILYPFAVLYTKVKLRKILKEIKELDAE